jgi:hypothetical protein
MKGKVVISCDPGITSFITVLNIETKDVTFIPNNTPPYTLIQILKQIESDYDIRAIGVEKVHAIPGTSAGSNFKFGYNTGTVVALLSTLDSSLYEIAPKAWQKHIGLTVPKGLKPATRRKRIKEGVGDICTKLYPKAVIHGSRGGLLHNKSDSLMIAHTTYQKYGN